MPKGDLIFQRLVAATTNELREICKTLSLDFPKEYINSEKELPLEIKSPLISEISAEYRALAGHTLLNLFRGEHDFPYKQILVDVADKLNPDWGWTSFSLDDHHSEEHIENTIEGFIFERIKKEWNKLSFQERKIKEEELKNELRSKGYSENIVASAFALIGAGAAGSLVAQPLVLSIFYSSFFYSIYASIFGISTELLLATGSVVGGIVAIPAFFLILGQTSYKKTIPVTLQLIGIRRRLEGEAMLEDDED